MRKFVILAAGGVALAIAAVTAHGFVMNAPGAGAFSALPANPALFGVQVRISPGAVATGGQGDTIVAVHEGRDGRSPYVAIEWIPNMAMHPPATQALLGAAVGNPFFPSVAAVSPNPANPTIWFVYRPTNDPVNPGWIVPAPGMVAPSAVGQLELAVQTCHDFANAVRQAIRFQSEQDNAAAGTPLVGAPPPPPVGIPGTFYVADITVNIDLASGGPTMGEFYDYNITTR